jgi:hypothetical protein
MQRNATIVEKGRDGKGRNQVTCADTGRTGLLEPLLLDDEAGADEEAGGECEHQAFDVVRGHALDPAPVPPRLGGRRLLSHSHHWAAPSPINLYPPRGYHTAARSRDGECEIRARGAQPLLARVCGGKLIK